MNRLLLLALLLSASVAEAVTDTFPASGTWTAPAGVTSVTVEVWGAGGAGGGQNMTSDGGGGGGGGAYSRSAVTVTPGNSYPVSVGAGGVGVAGGNGGIGGDSFFNNAATVFAKGGAGGRPSTGTPPAGGAGGSAALGVGTVKFSGGNGGRGRNSTTGRGGPGGSSAGTAANGTSGTDPWSTAVAAPAPAGGGIGGNGGNANGQSGFAPASGNGGGGGGAAEGTALVGGNGAGGLVTVTYTLPPSVMSIDCSASCTTNAASVSWAVTFSESMTGVGSSNFALVNSGLGGSPAITSVTGAGTTWTVTASTGTGSGTLGLDMVNTTGISPALINLPFSGQLHTVDRTVLPSVSSIVRADPNPTSQASVSWNVTFSESVTGVDATDFALVQTGVSGAIIASVTGSGTGWVVTVNGISGQGQLGLNLVDDDSVIDAAGNPLAGAGNGDFTGELYDVVNAAPIVYASPAACANVLGIGTQAWGTLTGPLANDNVVYATASVGDNQTTNYLQCTDYGFDIPLGATINGITVNVDRKASGTQVRDAELWLLKDVAGVPVIQGANRSTTTNYTTADVVEAHGGATDLWGSAWTAAEINNMNFGAALASIKAGTAGGARTVSVDHIQIGVSYTALPDHYELHLPASGIACLPSTVTVKACANDLCTVPYTTASGTAVTLATSAGVLGSTTLVFDAGGVASTTLSYPAATDGASASVTLAGEQIAATQSRRCCPDGASCAAADSCSAIFHTAGFIISGSAGGAEANVPGQVAGQSSETYYLRAIKTNTATQACEAALAGANMVNLGYECNNPTTCSASNLMSVDGGTSTTVARNDNGSVTSYTSVGMTFDANGNAPFVFNFSDVGQVTLHASKAAGGTLLTALTGSSNAFVVKPGGFVLSAIKRTSDGFVNPGAVDANGTRFVKAGESFSVTVTATTCTPASATCTVAGATTPNYGNEISRESVKLTSTLVAPVGGDDPGVNGTFGAFSDGVATADGISLLPDGVTASTPFSWGEVGIITLTPGVLSGDYLGEGDVIGTASGNVGRFYPDHFDTLVRYDAATKVFMPCPSRPGADAACPPSGDSSYVWANADAVWTYADAAARNAATGFVASDIGKIAWQSGDDSFWELTGIAPTWAVALVGKGFVYSSQPFSVQVTAKNLAGDTTKNYNNASAFSKAVTLTAWGALGSTTTQNPGGGALANNAVAAAAFAAGVATVATPAYTFAAAETAPTDIFLRAVDTDGVSSLRTVPADSVEGGVKVASGRIKLTNGHGSELLPLPLTATVQYYNGSFWTPSLTDVVTVPNSTDFALAFPAGTVSKPNNLAACETVLSVGGVAPAFTVRLSEPGNGNNGWTNLTLNLGAAAAGNHCADAAGGVATTANRPWLQFPAGTNPAVRATFGVYKGSNEFIYLRENY